MTYFFSQLLQHHNKASRVDAKTFVLSPRKIRVENQGLQKYLVFPSVLLRNAQPSGENRCFLVQIPRSAQKLNTDGPPH